MSQDNRPALVDPFGRTINYLRVSVTDRCDFRCVYCMSEQMTFLPRAKILTLEEIHQIVAAFVSLGTRKIRLTGGEPLIRNGVMGLVRDLGKLPGLDQLVITTNGSQLSRQAQELRNAGVKRVNISLDSLRPDRFARITRVGKLNEVIAGIDAARKARFDRIKLNAVILKGRNHDEVIDLVDFARNRELDIAFIEEMPLGEINDHDRGETYCSSEEIREIIRRHYPLEATQENTGGPSRYYTMEDSPSRIGFISPHSHNFCDTCNRVRLTAEGRLLLCLGNEHSVDLRDVVRRHPNDPEALKLAIRDALHLKPLKHEFTPDGEVKVVRFMNMTGG